MKIKKKALIKQLAQQTHTFIAFAVIFLNERFDASLCLNECICRVNVSIVVVVPKVVVLHKKHSIR